MTIWRVGMKACCIHEGEWRAPSYSFFRRMYHRWTVRFPEKGRVYIVASVEPLRTGGPGLTLLGCRPDSFVFHQKFFRPVVDRPTSIEVFTRLLNPSRVSEDA